MPPAIPIPTSVDDIDTVWFDSVLTDNVVAATTLEVIHGTATKVKVTLTLADTDGAHHNRTVWVKTGLEPHSKSIGTERVYAGETFFLPGIRRSIRNTHARVFLRRERRRGEQRHRPRRPVRARRAYSSIRSSPPRPR